MSRPCRRADSEAGNEACAFRRRRRHFVRLNLLGMAGMRNFVAHLNDLKLIKTW